MNSRPKNSKLQKDLSLVVAFDHQNDSSTYYCIYNSTIYAVHQITITDSEPFHLNLIKTRIDETLAKNLNNNSLELFTQWSDWSDCNRCPIGLRKRVGICKIRVICF